MTQTKTRFEESSGNVFEDLPGEAENLRIRARLMLVLFSHIWAEGLGQEEAAKLMGVTQPEVSYLLNGYVQKFTIDKLINMCSRAGLKVMIDTARA